VLPKLFRVLLVLWGGSLWSLGGWVTWVLFNAQPDRHLAGLLAGRLFSIETYVGLGVAALALTLPARARFKWGYLAVGVLAVNEWGLRAVLASARTKGAVAGLSFGAWHGVSAGLYLIACLAVLAFVWSEGKL
jgi:hypothetical protein